MKSMNLRLALLTMIAVAACGEPSAPPAFDTPAAPEVQTLSAASILEGVFHPDAVITCNINVAENGTACTSPQDPDTRIPGTIGGRGMHARLTRRVGVYKPDSAIFLLTLRVQNLLPQRIGTLDGGGTVTGVKAFLHTPPVVTVGTGTVTVANPNGVAEFTAPNQPYFQYNSAVESGTTTGQRSWVFNVPPTVTRFRFRVYISANVLPIVAYDMHNLGGNRDIYRINIDGTDNTRLTNMVTHELQPTVAQDRVVFVSYRDENADLYSVDLNGDNLTRLTNTPWNETNPALSPDGTRLAFISDQSGAPRIVTAAFDATGQQTLPLFGFNGVITGNPAWIGNTAAVAFATSAFGNTDIYKTIIASGLTSVVAADSTGANVEPRYNPQGTLMTYVNSLSGGTSQTDVWVYDVATTVRNRVTNNADLDAQPTWLHDGRIAFLTKPLAGPYALKWATTNGATVGTIPTTYRPENPFGVPLR